MYKFPVLTLSAVWLALACGPEPGTPAYIMKEIRAGKVVGGANLKKLDETEFAEMLEIINDPNSERLARLQLVERVTRMKLTDPYPKLRGLVNHQDPEVRIVLMRWLGSRSEPEAQTTLIEALKTEKEPAVEANIVGNLVRIGTQSQSPPKETVEALVAALQDAPGPRKKVWARVLSGWRGENVIATLTELLASDDTELAITAASSLVGPLQRPLETLVPLAIGMLNSKVSRIRSAGLGGLYASTFPGRISGLAACSEEQTQTLLSIAPELRALVARYLERSDLEEGEKKIAQKLSACFDKHNPNSSKNEEREE